MALENTAEKIEIQPLPIRRFTLGDLSERGPWLLKRLLKRYPNQTDRSIIGWLNGVIDNNDFLCLVMPGAVCFAERFIPDRLVGKFAVREVFVWVEDAENALLVQQAAQFYQSMSDWAKFQQIDKLIVCENSDVPIEQVRAKFGGRLHEIKTVFTRVG